MDFLAGVGGSLGLSIYGLETILSVLAVVTWGAFLLVTRPALAGDSFATGVQQSAVANAFPPHR
jgi:hypothetical protein